jgi:erythronate-4-phosphate dehydrogenase
MIKIIADDRIPFLRGVLEPYALVEYMPGNKIDKKSLTGADALLIRTRTKCTESLLKGTDIRFIGTATIGFDHIDTRYCESHGIKWTNAPGCNSSSVQQYIAAALLKMSMEFKFDLKDKTIGIIGVGNVGSKVSSFARAVGMNILQNDPPRARKEGDKHFTDFDTVLAEADIITMHVPLNFVGHDKTYHMINDRTVKKMKKGAWIINSSRGEVAETSTLKKGLDTGRIGGVVIDVWEHEPDFDIELMHKTFISTPHIAGYSTDGKANGTSMVVNSLSKFFDIPLGKWYPEKMPEPSAPVIEISGKGKKPEDIIREAVFHSYNITEDDIRLRFSPSDFEKQRSEYPLRREFPAYTVRLGNSSKQVSKMLEALGFNIS